MIIKKHVKIGISRAIGTVFVFGGLLISGSLLVIGLAANGYGTFSTNILGAKITVDALNVEKTTVNGVPVELTDEQKQIIMSKYLNKEE